jgi:hypothetical protein
MIRKQFSMPKGANGITLSGLPRIIPGFHKPLVFVFDPVVV